LVAWALSQGLAQLLPVFEIPNWTVRLLIVLLILGFPVALIFAWAFEITREGIKRTDEVNPAESIRQHAGRKLIAVTIALAAVATVLEGTVQKSGDKVRVNVQLIDARADAHLWAKSYDRSLQDLFAVESEVAQEIADSLRAKLSPSEINVLAQKPTTNTAAYDLFLKGEYEVGQGNSSRVAEWFRRAEADYREALALDPNFALAAARLAESALAQHWYLAPLPAAE